MGEPFLSGALFRQVIQELEIAAGHDVVWSSVGTLPAELRGECLDVLAIRWVHAATSVALVRAVAERTKRDPRALHDHILEKATERVFTTIWRTIFHFVNAEAMIMRVPVIFKRTYQGITAEAAMSGPSTATLRIRNWPGMDDLSLHGIATSCSVAVRVATKQEITVATERTHDGARYVLAWPATK
jgi:hypothetical protein